MRSRIGESLRRAGLVSEVELNEAMVEHARTGERLGVVLVRRGLVTEEQIAVALASQLGFQYVDLTDLVIDPAAVRLVPRDLSMRAACLAVEIRAGVLTVAMADPLLLSVVDDLERRTGYRIEQIVATRSAILDAVRLHHPEESMETAVGDAEPRAGLDESVLPLDDNAAGVAVDRILEGAVDAGATDVHIIPSESGVDVRYRVDGALRPAPTIPRALYEDVVARFKVLAGLDISERLLPQAGRIRRDVVPGGRIDFRVATLRTSFGEKVALRAHLRHKRVPALEELGLSDAALEDFRQCLRRGHGLIVVSGTAGSGRSTTIASALASVASTMPNVVAIERPIEYDLPGVAQTEVDESVGLTYAAALRAALQQDPDYILLGDLPDHDAAVLAMRSAQSGHRVLGGVLADDAAGAIVRVAELANDASAAASALIGAVGQRLVRRLCSNCRGEYVAAPAVLRALGLSAVDAETTFYQAVGCDQCDHAGYRGRVGLYEVLRVTERVRRLVEARAPSDEIRSAGIAGGMVTLAEDGLAKARAGHNSVDELLRVVADVRETRALCPSCGAAITVDFQACPRCGERLSDGCPHCGRALAPGWSFCPYCARSTEPASRGPKRGTIRLIRNSEPSDAV